MAAGDRSREITPSCPKFRTRRPSHICENAAATRRFERHSYLASGDRTGWLGREDSNSRIQRRDFASAYLATPAGVSYPKSDVSYPKSDVSVRYNELSRCVQKRASTPHSIRESVRARAMMSAKRAGVVPGGAKPKYLPSGPTRKMKLV